MCRVQCQSTSHGKIRYDSSRIFNIFSDNKEIIFQVKKNSTQLWKFIPTNENNYSIINKEGCYIKVVGLKLNYKTI